VTGLEKSVVHVNGEHVVFGCGLGLTVLTERSVVCQIPELICGPYSRTTKSKLVVVSVDLNKCGEGELDVSIISAAGNAVNSEVQLLEAGRLEVVYAPEEGGIHYAEVLFNSEPVTGKQRSW